MRPALGPLLVVTLVVAAVPEARAQSPQALYQQALRAETVRGDLEQAVALFQRVTTAPDRLLAARALIHIGRAYERLGRPGAEEPYRTVLARFADQPEPVAEARARLAVLNRANGGPLLPNPSSLVFRLVAAAEDLDWEGQVSPDGRLITTKGGVLSGGRSTVRAEADLLVHDLARGVRRRLTAKGGGEVAGAAVWSPDGSRIAYEWSVSETITELRVVGLDGSSMRTFFRGPGAAIPQAWAADGREVLALLVRRDTAELAMVPTAGGQPRVLATERDISWPFAAGFAPDGRWIGTAMRSERRSGDHDIVALPVDGGRASPLVDHPADDRFVWWAAEGVLFTSDRRGSTDLFILPTQDGRPAGRPVLLREGIGRITPSGIDRRGTLYYRRGVDVRDVFTQALDPSSWRTVGDPRRESGPVEGKSWLPDWSPDGEHFGYLALIGPAEVPTVVVRREATGEERRVTLPGDLRPFTLRVAPGGERVLVAGWGGDRVLMADLSSGTHQILSLARDQDLVRSYTWDPTYAWSPDGRRIFHTTFGGARRLMVRDLATGEERELYRVEGPVGVRHPVPSSDGLLLAFVVTRPRGTYSLNLMSADGTGGPARVLAQEDTAFVWPIAFTPDGRDLIYGHSALRVAPATEFRRMSVAGGGPAQPLGVVEGFVRLRHDGRRVAFVRDHSLTEIWALEGLSWPPAPAGRP